MKEDHKDCKSVYCEQCNKDNPTKLPKPGSYEEIRAFQDALIAQEKRKKK